MAILIIVFRTSINTLSHSEIQLVHHQKMALL